MKTTIDNTQRIFFIQRLGFGTRHFVCNLADIEKVLKVYFEVNDEYTISHIWDGKLKRMSKKALREMLEANQLSYNFIK